MFISIQACKVWNGSLAIIAYIALITASSVAAQSAKPANRSQALQTVFSNPAPISIADAPVGNTPPGVGSLYASTINVPVQGTHLVHLQVTLNNVSHAFPDDFDVLLVGPGGQSFVLQSDAGGNTSAVNRTYTFDDTGLTQLPNDGGITSGTYRPANHQGNDGASDVFPAPAPTGPYGNPGPQTGGNATMDGVFGGSDPNGVWSLFVTDDENLDAGNIFGGWSISITSIVDEPSLTNVLDFDGDAKTDMTVIRFTGGSATWYINRSNQGFLAQGWGIEDDVFVPHDYDGDGKTDIAVYRDGTWYILQSSNSALNVINFGIASDDPTVVDDYDGDGKADPAVVRNEIDGLKTWYILGSTSGFVYKQWGLSTDVSIPGDFDGDGKADLAVKRGAAGGATFYIDRSTLGFESFQWGNSADIVAPGDYDGDFKTDIAVAHLYPSGSDLYWYVRLSGGGIIENLPWGFFTDKITHGDYDGDGKTDIAVWRGSTGIFYIRGSAGVNIVSQWGQNLDYPPANYNTH